MPNKKQQKPENIPLKISPDIKQIYVSGAFGGFTHKEFRLALFSETLEPKGVFVKDGLSMAREAKYELIMSPLTVIELYNWLKINIEDFEKTFGKIEVPIDNKK